jgi:hypothetical protein
MCRRINAMPVRNMSQRLEVSSCSRLLSGQNTEDRNGYPAFSQGRYRRGEATMGADCQTVAIAGIVAAVGVASRIATQLGTRGQTLCP